MLRSFVISAATICLAGCFMPEAIVSSDRLAGALVDSQRVSSARIERDTASIHYVARASTGANLLVFIHGTPGDWKIFAPQLESALLADTATLVALDRPGWGRSSVDGGRVDPSLAEQSSLIGPALRDLKAKYDADNLVIVGHSLGGSLAPKIAMDHPAVVDAVVVIAGDLTDDYPAARWYNNLASWMIVSWMLPGSMAKANDEVLALRAGLADMKIHWRTIRAPMLVIQGQRDGLVDPRHADFAESLATDNVVKVVRFDDGDHLLHLRHSQRVNRLLAQVVLREQNHFFEMTR